MPLLVTLQRNPGLLRLRMPPGTQFSYSNTGFVLAAAVLQAAVGGRYEAWARCALLLPLGRTATDFDVDAAGAPTGHLDFPLCSGSCGAVRAGHRSRQRVC
jgi:CubicO group peptidase (beta-lactamase class C family)